MCRHSNLNSLQDIAERQWQKVGSKGEGSVFQRTDGRWCATLTVESPDTKRRRKSWYFGTQREALAKLTEERAKQQQSLPIAIDDRQTVGRHLQTWLEHSVKVNVRPLTFEQYHDHVKRYLAPVDSEGRYLGPPALGKFALSKLRPDHVRAFLQAMAKRGLAPRTIRISVFVLRRALQQAVEDKLLQRNVVTLVKAQKVERSPVNALTAEQAAAFEKALTEHKWGLGYLIGIRGGLRRGEVLGLRWSDIDFDQKTLLVARSLNRIKGAERGRLELAEPKTSESHRPVPFGEEAAVRLRRHRAAQLARRLAQGPDWKGADDAANDLIFTSKWGTPVEPRAFTRGIKRVLEAAGLPASTTVHSLRHTVATLALRGRESAHVVAALLGHSNVATTLRIYAHASSGDVRTAVESVERAITAKP